MDVFCGGAIGSDRLFLYLGEVVEAVRLEA
jgi:hypothetical protein